MGAIRAFNSELPSPLSSTTSSQLSSPLSFDFYPPRLTLQPLPVQLFFLIHLLRNNSNRLNVIPRVSHYCYKKCRGDKGKGNRRHLIYKLIFNFKLQASSPTQEGSRVLKAALSALSMLTDHKREALELGVEFLDLVPVPGLASAAKSVPWRAVGEVDMNLCGWKEAGGVVGEGLSEHLRELEEYARICLYSHPPQIIQASPGVPTKEHPPPPPKTIPKAGRDSVRDFWLGYQFSECAWDDLLRRCWAGDPRDHRPFAVIVQEPNALMKTTGLKVEEITLARARGGALSASYVP
ncbi:hypothetical protein BDQ17DRAFT_1436385 [Cyathus striatus]|nr:hypothetical protein BDQ17DRAFT_1436385 [Cyathus striatus]